MSTDAVIFDLDGTLVDTPSGIAEVLVEVVGSYGRTVSAAEAKATVGKPLGPSIAALAGWAADDERVPEAITAYRALFDERLLPRAAELVFDGVFALLDGLAERGALLGIATSKSAPVAHKLLLATGLRAKFGAVWCDGMTLPQGGLPASKPAPDLALAAAAELGVQPDRCVVVGDAVGDIGMGLSGGMRAVGVSYGVGTREELLAAGAESVVGAPAELLGVVGPLGKAA